MNYNYEKGFLYVAGGPRYIVETKLAINRLKDVTSLPICVVSDEEFFYDFSDDNIVHIKIAQLKEHRYSAKVIGLLNSPFKETIYMDSDTYVIENIDHLFSIFNLVDLFFPYEPNVKSHEYHDKYLPHIPELNSGVIGIKKNQRSTQFLTEWKIEIDANSLNTSLDMPYLRICYIKNINKIPIHVLPENYNMHGLSSLKIICGKVFVIHERLGYFKESTSKYMRTNQYMNKIARGINRIITKRIYLPFYNLCIPTAYLSSDFYFLKFRKLLGYKRMSKRDLILRND